ncbi:MAG: phosphatidylserine decarboxylase [Bacteroidetes bacterium]|nr:MAG: phosphatidylserine decarboxylase [Bacteroidota bacterium]
MKLPQLYNRQTQSIETENTYKVEGLSFLYNTFLGKLITYSIFNKKLITRLYAMRMKSKGSLKEIPGFIQHYGINTDEIKRPMDSFTSFNDFFIRELKEGARPIDQTPEHLISPADSRLFAFDLAKTKQLPIKGYWYSLQELLLNDELAKVYEDGLCLVYRLAPADYHRYGYIDNGTQEKVIRIPGVLHSVHPIALAVTQSLMAKNYRELTVLKTQNFGEVLHLEVGAMMVGKIVQRFNGAHEFKRGEEKGYFEFGGSTVIQFFKKGSVKLDQEILDYSLQGIETLVKINEKVGVKA